MTRRSLYSWLFVIGAALLCTACGGGSSSSNKTYLRLVNATQVNNLLLTTYDSDSNATVSASGVSSGTDSAYASDTSGTYSVVVSAADGSLLTSSTSSLSLSADVYYTVMAYAYGGQIKLLAITDNKTTPTSGYASLTIANPGSDAGALDIYLVSPGGSITDGLSPTFSNVTAAGSSLTNSVNAGTYDIIVTGYNKPSDLRLTMSSVALTSTNVYTLALTNTTGGALVNGALVQQKGGVQLQMADKARVRIAAAAPGGVTSSHVLVAASVNGTALASVTAPAVGNYELIPAGSSVSALSVNGVAITAPTATFTSGGDYTILVYGASATTEIPKVFADNNQTPGTSGAKIRLINGAVTGTGISLVDNNVQLFSEVTYGNTSAYLGITAGSSSLQLTSPSATPTSYTISQQSIVSGGVYTLFVLSNFDSQPVLRRDRN